jgi:hypothetical protein
VDTDVGYYGERLVLLAQHLGLNTCWVGLSYDKRKARAELTDDDQLGLVIAIGYGANTGKPHKSKPLDRLGAVKGGGPMPDWFRHGLEAAALAPTGFNRQLFILELDGTKVHATPGSGRFAAIDLGAVKYHFEIGANSDEWQWG